MSPYLAVEVGWMRHPKVRRVHRDARLLWLAAGLHAVEHETNGIIEKHMLGLLASQADVKASRAAELVAAGLWEDHGEHYRIHDFLTYNPSREEREAVRAKWRDKKRRGRMSPGDTPGESPEESQGDYPGESPDRHSYALHSTALLLQQQAGTTQGTSPPPAAAAAIDLVLEIRRDQDGATIRNEPRWRAIIRPGLVEQHMPTMLAYLGEHPDADPNALVAACGFTEWDIARARRGAS